LGLKIGLITSSDVMNIKAWSGTHHRILQSLVAFGDVVTLGPADAKLAKMRHFLSKIIAATRGEKYLVSQTISVSKYLGRIFQERINGENYDLLFAPAASSEIAYLETKIPIIYLSDTTFALMVDYYEGFSKISARSRREANIIEARALTNANKVIFPTSWAANSAVRDYGLSRGKISVIPFGANIDEVPDRRAACSRRISSPLRLLFLGVSWSRKGGPTAYKTTMELNKRGIDTVLTICGLEPPSEYINEKVRVIPFLDKSDEADAKAFNKLLLESHFLILPTKAECFGIVFCEAAAFGLPVIATKTGGIPEVVDDKKTGMLIDSADDFDGFADAIASIANDSERYNNMVMAARAKFDQSLNWRVWTQRVKLLVQETIRNGQE